MGAVPMGRSVAKGLFSTQREEQRGMEGTS